LQSSLFLAPSDIAAAAGQRRVMLKQFTRSLPGYFLSQSALPFAFVPDSKPLLYRRWVQNSTCPATISKPWDYL
jgi:hypothetical protein